MEQKKVSIQGVHVDPVALKDIASLDALKKTDIFSHLSQDKQAAAYAELWDELKPAATVPAQPKAFQQAEVKP